MIDLILDYSELIKIYLWGPWTMVFFAFIGVYLTFRSGFFQVRRCRFIARNTIGRIFVSDVEETEEKMTPFQAAATSLAGTVGMGNIAGVATALSVGGPGAIFWMWVLAFFGMMTKTVEITLGVHYRDIDDEGKPHGGPMYYITKGLGWVTLAKLYSIGTLIATALSTTLLQSHTVGRAFLTSYDLNPYLTTSLMAVVTGTVVIGGFKRIGRFSERIVPLMSVLYIFGGLFILLMNYTSIPGVFRMIFAYAFSPAPMVGGFAGAAVAAAIQNGMSRGLLSNEAGQGTAAMAHATADTPHPFKQGMWGAFEVFIDTIIICTITSFVILSTGVFSGTESGVELVITAFSSAFSPGIAGALISFSILFFCLSTQIGFFVYYETAIVHLFGKNAMNFCKWLYLLPGVIFAGVANVDKLWIFADISVGVTCIPNLIAVLALSGVFFTLMRDYLTGTNEFTTEASDRANKYVRSAMDME
ncbi:alanine/glycine:cation symporter family protein [candidate division KSB1 bacterium]